TWYTYWGAAGYAQLQERRARNSVRDYRRATRPPACRPAKNGNDRLLLPLLSRAVGAAAALVSSPSLRIPVPPTVRHRGSGCRLVTRPASSRIRPRAEQVLRRRLTL